MPHGYVRWMKFCQHLGNDDCTDWVLGAVQMPNGPFHVVAGRIHGNTVHPDSGDQGAIAKAGGPLHLVVTYTGHISNGGGVASYPGYTFGLIGYVAY
jgi:hypothetical protein